jgi:type I restriction enzyme R subunit
MTSLQVLRDMFHGLDYQGALAGTPADRLAFLPKAMSLVLDLEGEGADQKAKRKAGRKRFLDAVAELTSAFKLAAGTPEADAGKVEVGFFVAVETAIAKLDGGASTARMSAAADCAIGQLVNEAVTSTEVIDVLSACGLERPDIGVLSDEFLARVRALDQKNVAVEALRRLLDDEIASRTRTNVVKSEEFSERLREAIIRYHNGGIDAL